jgi:hypothetical protein
MILPGGKSCHPCQRRTVPGHPLGRVGFQFGGMALQFRGVVEGIRAVEFAGVNQAHLESAHLSAMQGLVEQRVFSFLLRGFSPTNPEYPAASRAAIRRTMAPNSRRVRSLSTCSNAGYCLTGSMAAVTVLLLTCRPSVPET